MATINRTYYKESNTCTSLFMYLVFFLFSMGNLPLSSAQGEVLQFEESEVPLAYVSPFKHGKDGYKEVFYEAGMTMKLEEKTNIILPDIFFAYGDAAILPQSKTVLRDLIRLLNENPALAIELSAHTDSRGRSYYNERLSRNRARSLVKYLTRNGVEADRLLAVGRGEGALRNHCGDGIVCSEQEHRENRRIEMRTARIVGRLLPREGYIYKEY